MGGRFSPAARATDVTFFPKALQEAVEVEAAEANGNVPQHRWPKGLCDFTSVFNLAGKVKMSEPC